MDVYRSASSGRVRAVSWTHVTRARSSSPRWQSADVSQQRDHDISSAELHGEPGGGEQAPAAARRLAELGGASHRRDRDRDRAPAAVPVLLPASSSSAMSSCSPESSAARCHARRSGWSWSTSASASWTRRRSARPALCAIADADERMPEADRLQIGVDDACLGRRPGDVEIHRSAGDGGARCEDLVESVLVAERGHEQQRAESHRADLTRGRRTRARAGRSTARRRPATVRPRGGRPRPAARGWRAGFRPLRAARGYAPRPEGPERIRRATLRPSSRRGPGPRALAGPPQPSVEV